ncbi:MAG: class I SAM-dependent methyltransferase [Holophagales bacterium]|nr:class I SAM-dependent methyltransferase [Holophagales bacterium]
MTPHALPETPSRAVRRASMPALSRLAFFARRQLSRSPRLEGWARTARRRWWPGSAPSDAARHWDGRVDEVESEVPLGWLDVELVEVEHVRPRISGDTKVSFLEHFLRCHVPDPPAGRWLSLGCGGGNLERAILALGAAEHVVGLDLSPESIALARRLASEAGLGDRLTYSVHDADRDPLEPGAYRVVVIKHALHHFLELEHVYSQIRRTLEPGGLLMLNELVGPSRFQWTDLQLGHMNRILASLPRELRRRAPVIRIQRPRVQDMLALDPSEAARSAEILPLLETSGFEILEHKPYGGTLLHILLGHLLPLLDLDTEEHVALLRSMIAEEEELLDSGELPSDFSYVVARPRPAARNTDGHR